MDYVQAGPIFQLSPSNGRKQIKKNRCTFSEFSRWERGSSRSPQNIISVYIERSTNKSETNACEVLYFDALPLLRSTTGLL